MPSPRFSSKGVGIKYRQKPVSVMLPEELDKFVRSLPNRSEYIRTAIAEKKAREESTCQMYRVLSAK